MGKVMSESLDKCLFFTIKKLDRILDKIAEEAFRPTGLSPTYGFVLLAINEKPGIMQREVADLLHTAPSTIARFAEKLENKNLIYYEQSGRKTLMYLTPKGIELIDTVNQAWEDLHKGYADILGKIETDELALRISRMGDTLKNDQSK